MQQHYLVIDAGNTNTEVGLYREEGYVCSWRLSSDPAKTEDEYYCIIRSLANQKKVDLSTISACAIASVVPELTRIYVHLFKKYFSARTFIITGDTDLGLKFLTEDHSYIGADLIINAYAARQKYNSNIIICDYGTATTVQLISSDGTFYGTIIAPGISTGSIHLFEKASLLSKIQLEAPKKILGINTKESLLSGIVRGHCYMTDSFIREIKKEYCHLGDFQVIATGGITHLLSQFFQEVVIIDKTLTIDGLYYYCRNNIKK